MYVTLCVGIMEQLPHNPCIFSASLSRTARKPKATERPRIVKPQIQKDINSNIEVELTAYLILWYFCAFPRKRLASSADSTIICFKAPSLIHVRRLLASSCLSVGIHQPATNSTDVGEIFY
jgi:hypothetical protein